MTLFESLAGTQCMSRWDEGSWHMMPLDTEGFIIVEQRNYSLYKAMDALFGVPVFSYSVLDTMNVHAL